MIRHRLHREQGPGNINVKDAVVVAARDLGNRRGGKDGGIVYQYVNLAQLLDGFRNRCLDTVLRGNIHMHCDGIRAQRRCRRSCARGIDIRDGYARALAAICLCKSQTDPARRTRDEGRFTLEPAHSIRRPFASNLWMTSLRGVM